MIEHNYDKNHPKVREHASSVLREFAVELINVPDKNKRAFLREVDNMIHTFRKTMEYSIVYNEIIPEIDRIMRKSK